MEDVFYFARIMGDKQNMIRVLLAAIVAGMVLMGCDEENPSGDTRTSHRDTLASPAVTADDTTTHDSLLALLLELEAGVMAGRDDPDRAEALLMASFDTSSGCFLTVGSGVRNPAHPEGARKEGQRMAARRRAGYWAMYLKAWRKGRRLPFKHPLSGKIIYSKTLYEKERGDTLYLLMQTPHGSIIVNLPD
jgi:hypothetical protein